MTHSTPIATTHAAALARVLDNVPKGYTRYTSGTIAAAKIGALALKFHDRHAIAASASQRYTRKRHGRANALLTIYRPDASQVAQWLLLFTSGELDSNENLRLVSTKPRLSWLGYELIRHPFRGRTSWTWKREKEEMEGLFGLLVERCSRRDWKGVREVLEIAAHQPGFHGVREQTWQLCQEARKRGYEGPLPTLFYMAKTSHGKPLNF